MAKKACYGSRFLYAEDLLKDQKWVSPLVEVEKFYPPGSLEAADKTKIHKPSVQFKNSPKILVLCNTNVKVLHYLTGFSEDQAAKWIGAKIRIAARLVESFGQEVVAVRIMPPAGARLRKSVITRLGKPVNFTPGKGTHE